MSQQLTEHSKKLRARTAAEWDKQKLASGEIRQILIKTKSEIADDFDAIAQELGLSRPQTLKLLCARFHATRNLFLDDESVELLK